MNTVELAFRCYGDMNTAPPVVILHGLLGAKENWHTVAKRLSEQVPVITVDLRNHGDSAHDSTMSYRLMAADVAELLSQQQISQVTLLGHSMGGKVAMVMAHLFPSLVQQLIVVDIAPKSYPLWHQSVLSTLADMPVGAFKNRAEADAFLSKDMDSFLERSFILKNLARSSEGGFSWKCNLPSLVKHYLKIASFPYQFSEPDLPVLFIKGALSDYIDESEYDLIKQYFPLAAFRAINSAGHMPHIEQVEEFMGVVESCFDTQ